MTTRIWFIPGASAGIGRALAEAALARGDRVAATAHAVGMLDDLRARYGEQVLALQLDVTRRASAIAAVQRAVEVFGSLDVVLDNAGYGIALLEEAAEDAALRARVEDNFFASLWVTHAALPYLRAQRTGHLLQVSSVDGVVTLLALCPPWRCERTPDEMGEELARELEEVGVKRTHLQIDALPYDATDLMASALLQAVDAKHAPRHVMLGGPAANDNRSLLRSRPNLDQRSGHRS